VWVGSYAGLQRLDPVTGSFTAVWVPERSASTGKEPGVKWVVSTRDEVVRFDAAPGLGGVRGNLAEREPGALPFADEWVGGIIEDRLGTRFLFGAAGLFGWEDGAWVAPALDVSLEGVVIRCARADREGNLWLGTQHHGLWRLRPQTVGMLDGRQGLPHEDVWSISESAAGELWVGTSSGVSVYRNGVFQTPSYLAGLGHLSFRPVLADRAGDLWLGATDRDFFHFRREAEGYRHIPKASAHPQTRAIYQDRSGAIWIGTKGGVTRLRPRDRQYRTTEGVLVRESHGEQWIYRQNEVRYLADGEQWIGREGRWWRDGSEPPESWSTAKLREWLNQPWVSEIPEGRLAGDEVQAILEDSTGVIWLGTDGTGLSRLAQRAFTTFTVRDGLASDSILALCEDTVGTLWIGTRGGLTRWHEGRFTTLTTAQGLFDNLINQILEDQAGHLWFGCHRGVFRAGRDELNAVCDGRQTQVRCLALGEGDGMHCSQVNGGVQPAGGRARDGRLWFPTSRGVAVVDPARLRFDPPPPVVVIERVRATDVLVKEHSLFSGLSDQAAGVAGGPDNPPADARPDRRRWPPGSGRFVEFQYAAANLTAPERVHFRYRLEGHAADWIEAGSRRTATYANLGPGRYRFAVMARNRHGLSSEPAVFAFELAPTLSQAAWFRALLTALAIIGAYVFHRRRLRVRMQLAELETQNRLAQERARIGRDLHDDLGASLARTAVLLTLAQRGLAPSARGTALRLLEQIEEAIRLCQQKMRQVIWATNPSNDTVEGLMNRVCQFAQEYLEPLHIRCRFDLPPEWPALRLSAEARQNLFLAAKEAIHNAARHAQASELRLAFHAADGRCQLVIADNGRGLPDPTVEPDHSGQGLANLRHRLQAVAGRLRLTSAPGQGTTVTLDFPAAL